MNEVSCCHQIICTDCYCALCASKSEVLCPYCSNNSFTATYTADSSSLNATPSCSSSPSSKRSSHDAPPKSCSSPLIKATVLDREVMEIDMRVQRSNSRCDPYFSHPLPPLPSSSLSSSPSSRRGNNSSSNSFARFSRSGYYGRTCFFFYHLNVTKLSSVP